MPTEKNKEDNNNRINLQKKKKLTQYELNEALLTNFVQLQKVLTNLSLNFENLSKNISHLLELFELSAKSFTGKESGKHQNIDDDFLKKLDSLLEQNKVISKGIMLMEERIRNKSSQSPLPEFRRPIINSNVRPIKAN